MIMKFGKQEQGFKLYKIYMIDDPGLTLTCFMARSNLVVYVSDWEKLLKYKVI